MRFGEAAEAAGVPTQTIRFYERRGLLPQPRRDPNGYRDQGYPSEPTSFRQGVSRQGRLARGRSKLGG